MNFTQHRKHLAKTSARRETLRQRRAIERYPVANAERAQKREDARDLYDMGLQSTPSKAGFPETPKAKEVKRRPRRKPRRGPESYRAQRVNSHRSSRAKFLKAERVAKGETRSQADRRRWEAAQSA